MRRQPLLGWKAGSSILRFAALTGMVSLLVITTVAWAVGTEHTAVSALVGAAVVFTVLLVGILGISAVVAGDANLSMAGAAVVYIGQIVLIVAALLILRDQSWMVGRAFAIGAIVQVLAMQVAQVVGYQRGRHVLTADLSAHSAANNREEGR